jgi:quercetin dioxygenase-like cupin family protein
MSMGSSVILARPLREVRSDRRYFNMHVTKRSGARTYQAVKHHGMAAFRLQGQDASPARTVSVGLSLFLPGGGAEKGSSPSERIYVVLEGAITVITKDSTVTLGPLDSCLIEANEERSVENRSNDVAKMLVIAPS